MTEFPKSISFETGLGRFDFTASAQPSAPGKTVLTLAEYRPDVALPEGMHVDRCRSVVLKVRSNVPLLTLRFECRYRGDAEGGSCTGQGLDAQAWENDLHLVTVGTEDHEFLALRMPFLTCLNEWVGEYSAHSLAIVLNKVDTCGKELSFHFTLAENPSPEPADDSTWFAVDCPHDRLTPL